MRYSSDVQPVPFSYKTGASVRRVYNWIRVNSLDMSIWDPEGWSRAYSIRAKILSDDFINSTATQNTSGNKN